MDEAPRFLVTGAQGFLGRHLVQALLASYPAALVLGVGRSPCTTESFTHSISWAGKSFRAPVPAYLRNGDSERYQYQLLDLLDAAATARIVQEFRPAIVIHLASGLRGDPVDRLMRSGVESTVRLTEVLGSLTCLSPRLLLCSSGAVYGQVPEHLLPIREDAPTRPAELYGVAKLAAEHACRVVAARCGMPVTCARVFNLVGPGQDERHVCGRFVAQAAAISLGLQPARVDTADLQSTRDFIDVRDCARALVLLARKGTAGETYNVASGVETTIASVLETVLEQLSLKDRVQVSSRESSNAIRRHFASVARLSSLGFTPEWPMAESLRDLRDYYLRDVSCLS